MKSKKIAILSLPYGPNYGCVLQQWSLYTYIKKQGYSVIFLNRRWNRKRNFFNWLKSFVHLNFFICRFSLFYKKMNHSPYLRSTEELKDEIEKRCSAKVKYVGWLSSEESYPHFAMADLVVFPGRHSVFGEQVAGMGIPMVVKYWEGTTHIDRGGNVKFLREDSSDEIKKVIEDVFFGGEIERMKNVALNNKFFFSYRNIAKRCIV